MNAPLDALAQIARVPIYAEATTEDGEIESGIIVVNVGDARHGDEWEIMEEPPDHRVYTGVVEMVDLLPRELVEATLPADGVPCDHAEEEDEGECGTPIYDGVAKEEVLDNVIIPAAHAQTNMEEWPLPRF